MARVRGLALFLVLAGCARPVPPSPWEKLGVRVVDGVPQLSEVEIELERTECYGSCPAYTVKLSGDGTLIYAGKSYAKARGEHATAFEPQKLLPLLERFGELDFLAQQHACSVMVVDNSHARIALRIGARSNSAFDGVVDADDATNEMSAEDKLWHRKMFELQNAIDAAADIEFWIGTQAERSEHRSEWR